MPRDSTPWVMNAVANVRGLFRCLAGEAKIGKGPFCMGMGKDNLLARENCKKCELKYLICGSFLTVPPLLRYDGTAIRGDGLR